MKHEVKIMAEYYAIGMISLSQLKEVCASDSEFLEAKKHSEEYGNKYDKAMMLLSEYETSKKTFEEVIVECDSLREAITVFKCGMSVWVNTNVPLYNKTQYQLNHLKEFFAMAEGETDYKRMMKWVKRGYSIKDLTKIYLDYHYVILGK